MIYQTAAHITAMSTPVHQRGTKPMTKLVLKPGIDRNGNRAPRYVRATSNVDPIPVSPTSKRVGAKSLVPERKTAPANAPERSFEHGVTGDITFLDGGGAILHVGDHATGLSSDSFIDTSSDLTVRHDTWAVLNKLLDRIDRANARAARS